MKDDIVIIGLLTKILHVLEGIQTSLDDVEWEDGDEDPEPQIIKEAA